MNFSSVNKRRTGGRPDAARDRSRASAFTLIELLTVLAIIAVLASLLLTAIMSARKKSRAVVCTFNLRQISLALNMYLDDVDKRPPGVDGLVGGKYLSGSRNLLCPEDKTGNWGMLVQSGSTLFVTDWNDPPIPLSPVSESAVKYSYLLHPLIWDEPSWNRLIQAGASAGVAACQLHGLGNQDVPDLRSYSGLLLRAQRDGAVVRRQIFWNNLSFLDGSVPATIPSGFGGASGPYPLQIYLDDPASWLQNQP
jgi:prepilin-type N-terminal cleavage/methylation domain-containing protein